MGGLYRKPFDSSLATRHCFKRSPAGAARPRSGHRQHPPPASTAQHTPLSSSALRGPSKVHGLLASAAATVASACLILVSADTAYAADAMRAPGEQVITYGLDTTGCAHKLTSLSWLGRNPDPDAHIASRAVIRTRSQGAFGDERAECDCQRIGESKAVV